MTLARRFLDGVRGVCASPFASRSRRKARRIRPQQHRFHLRGFEPLEQRSLLSVTLLSEGFEGSFPSQNGWSVGDANSAGTSAYWDDVNSSFGGEGIHSGSWKGYCAGVGKAGTNASPTYQNSMSAYMSKSINLAGLSSASLSFWYKIPSIESGNRDHLRAYIDSTKVFDVSSAATSWTQSTINLNSYLGASRTLKFEFYSNSSGTAEGAYLDDILVTGEQAGSKPDLTVTNVDGPSTGTAGQSISVIRSIKNNGPGNITGNYDVGLYLSSDSNITTGDYRLELQTVTSGLSSGTTSTFTRSVTLPTGYTGTYYIGAIADPANAISEVSDSNNTGYDGTPIVISAPVQYPDLQGYDLYPNITTTSWGQTVNVQARLRNAGAAASSAFQVQWYVSRDAAGSSDDILLSRTNGDGTTYSHPAIAGNSYGSLFTVTLQLPTSLPSGWGGTSFYIIQKADSAGQVNEGSNENNNFGQIGDTYDRSPVTILADDFANLGDWTHAANIHLSTSTNKIISWIPFVDGWQSGKIDASYDTDVFKFVSEMNGTATITMSASLFSSLDSVVKVYNSTGQLIASRNDVQGSGAESVAVPIVAGGRYYVVAAGSGVAVGQYSVKIDCSSSSAIPSAFGTWLDGLKTAANVAKYSAMGIQYDLLGELTASGFSADVLAKAAHFKDLANTAGMVGDVCKYIKIGTLAIDVGAKLANTDQRVEGSVDALNGVVTTVYGMVAGPVVESAGAKIGALIGSAIAPGIGTAIGLAAGGVAGGLEGPVIVGNLFDIAFRESLIDVFCAIWASPPGASLTNGGFEYGNLNGWTVTAGGQFPKLVTTAPASGTYALQLGDGGGGLGGGNTASIQQTVNISSSATVPRLSLKYKVQGTDGAAWDWMRVYINNTQIASWSTDTGGWQTFTYDLSAFKGQSVTLKLSSWTADTFMPVNYFLDDLSIIA